MNDTNCDLFCIILDSRIRELDAISDQVDTIKTLITSGSAYDTNGPTQTFSASLVEQNSRLVKLIREAGSMIKREVVVGKIELKYFDCHCRSYGMLPLSLYLTSEQDIPFSEISTSTLWTEEYVTIICTVLTNWLTTAFDVYNKVKQCCCQPVA